MKSINKQELEELYTKNNKSNLYSFFYPKRKEINYVLVLNDTSSFEEQLKLEATTQEPFILYNILTKNTFDQTLKIVENPIQFFTTETFEFLKILKINER